MIYYIAGAGLLFALFIVFVMNVAFGDDDKTDDGLF